MLIAGQKLSRKLLRASGFAYRYSDVELFRLRIALGYPHLHAGEAIGYPAGQDGNHYVLRAEMPGVH